MTDYAAPSDLTAPSPTTCNKQRLWQRQRERAGSRQPDSSCPFDSTTLALPWAHCGQRQGAQQGVREPEASIHGYSRAQATGDGVPVGASCEAGRGREILRHLLQSAHCLKPAPPPVSGAFPAACGQTPQATRNLGQAEVSGSSMLSRDERRPKLRFASRTETLERLLLPTY